MNGFAYLGNIHYDKMIEILSHFGEQLSLFNVTFHGQPISLIAGHTECCTVTFTP
jgi:hypothetical protein